jgi:hypothetical protein
VETGDKSGPVFGARGLPARAPPFSKRKRAHGPEVGGPLALRPLGTTTVRPKVVATKTDLGPTLQDVSSTRQESLVALSRWRSRRSSSGA